MENVNKENTKDLIFSYEQGYELIACLLLSTVWLIILIRVCALLFSLKVFGQISKRLKLLKQSFGGVL